MPAARNTDQRSNHFATTTEQTDCELITRRIFNAPRHLVFEAWTTPALLTQWWAPKSFGIALTSCVLDARPGGSYRFEFSHPTMPSPMVFFGRYLEVVVPSRLVWTNEEAGDAGPVSTLTLEAVGTQTRLELRERYPSRAALEAAIASGSASGMTETFDQLDQLLGQPRV